MLEPPAHGSPRRKRGPSTPALDDLHDAMRTGFDGAPSASPWASILSSIDTVGQRPETTWRPSSIGALLG